MKLPVVIPSSRNRLQTAALVALVTTLALYTQAEAQESIISFHDNLEPAGSFQSNQLSIDLVAEQGMWYPGGEDGFGMHMYAFREDSGELLTPGPLVRVTQGTEIRLSIRNELPSGDLHLNGFHGHNGEPGLTVVVPQGESRSIRFEASLPGAFLYWASVNGAPFNLRREIDSHLSGAFVVDPIGYYESDRILVLGEFQERDPQTNDLEAEQYTINGRSWPQTELIDVEVGETNRWHIINGAFAGHPMHLHGVHYRVAGIADSNGYRIIPTDMQREVVTEVVNPGQTVTMEWEAVNAGNWLFHCHIVAHVDPAVMYSVRGRLDSNHEPSHDQHMSGMTLGIRAHGSDKYDTDAQPTRFLTMELNHMEKYYGDSPGITVAFNQKGSVENTAVSPGPPLFLNKDELVSIEVINNLHQATSIHWHGMELQSYYDGVAGFGGNGSSVTPEIEPGHSFEVRMQPPKAGTFLYHTHLNDAVQLSGGLYGAMIVSDRNDPFDAENDRLFVIGLLGENNPQGLRLGGRQLGINGSSTHSQQFTVGQEYRLRVTNIAANNAGFAVWLNSPAGYEEWTPVAQDGADLPISYQVPVLAQRQRVSVGETFDFMWTPKRPGQYWLDVRRGNGEFMAQAQLLVSP